MQRIARPPRNAAAKRSSPYAAGQDPSSAIAVADRVANRVAEKLFLPLGNLFWAALIGTYLLAAFGIIS